MVNLIHKVQNLTALPLKLPVPGGNPDLLINLQPGVQTELYDILTDDELLIMQEVIQGLVARGHLLVIASDAITSLNALPAAQGGGGGGTPAGSNLQIQYNDNGAFGASSGLTWDNSSQVLNINENAYPQIRFNLADGITNIAAVQASGTNGSLLVAADNEVHIVANQQSGPQAWVFDPTGKLSLPGGLELSNGLISYQAGDLGISTGGSLYMNDGSSFSIDNGNIGVANGMIAIATVGAPVVDASAALQIDSTTKGFLLPRMTEAQRNSISNPPYGLMVYTTDHSDIDYWAQDNTWKTLYRSGNIPLNAQSTSYNPNPSFYWSGQPFNVQSALDRLAAAVYALQGNNPIN